MITINLLNRIDVSNIICAYQYGSKVYGNYRKNSDYDFIVIVKNKTNEQFSDNSININFFTKVEHQQRLNNHEISALEAYFCPSEFRLIEKENFYFNLNLQKLRKSISAKSSNSFVKAKKKLTIKKDFDLDIGRKSLFHSFRIIDFGIQIATHGKIIDYSSSNDLFYKIMNYYTWNNLFKKYKKLYNLKMSEFRKLAPKI